MIERKRSISLRNSLVYVVQTDADPNCEDVSTGARKMISQRKHFASLLEASNVEGEMFDQWFCILGVQVSTQVRVHERGAWLIVRASNMFGVDDQQVLLPGFEPCDPLGHAHLP